MKNRRLVQRSLAGGCGAILVLALAACSSDKRGGVSSSGGKLVMKIALTVGPSDPEAIAAKAAAAAITKDSKGKIKATVYPNGVLGESGTVEDDLVGGSIVQATVTVKMDDRCAESGLLELPYMFDDTNQAHAGVDGPTAQKIYASCAKKGYAIPAVWESGFRDVLSNKAINSASDVKGLKLRVASGPIFQNAYKALGAAPTSLDKNQVYTAMQQGVVDGVEFPIPDIYNSSFMEVEKHLAITNTIYGAAFVVVSNKWLNALPDDLRAIVVKDITAQTAPERKALESEIDEDLASMQSKYGVKVTHPDITAFEKALAPYRAAQAKALGQSLFDGILADAKSSG